MSNEHPRDAAPYIQLDHFLKLRGLAETGGQAKLMIQAGEVQVNGQSETRRGRKLVAGDTVQLGGKRYAVEAEELR